MSDEEIDRKITVIFATDVVGYSKHMENDESGTVKNLRACEKILMKLFKDLKGRLFNTGGDSFLAEFPSAVSAVECAVAFQEAIQERNTSNETTVKLEFRIGINSGDVIKEKDNLLGDGVNIAARLEALAQTNGITISKGVYDFIKGKTKYEFNDLGLQNVKQNEFHAYDLLLNQNQKRKLSTSKRSQSAIWKTACIAGIICLVGLLSYFFIIQQNPKKTSEIKDSMPVIMVAPLNVVSSTGDNQPMGQAMTESMISVLSQFNGIIVISSNASFQAEKNSMSDEDLINRFGVDHVVRGSVQFSGDNGRISVELADLLTQKVSWTKRLDFQRSELFLAQDEVSQGILKELQINITGGIQGTNWAADFKDFEVYTKFLNWRLEWRRQNRESHLKAEQILKEMSESDISELMKLGLSAWQLFQRITLGLSTDKEQDLAELNEKVNTVFDLSASLQREEGYVLKTLTGLYLFNLSCEKAKEYISKALSYSGQADTWSAAGRVYARCGAPKKAIDALKKALALDPADVGWLKTQNLIAFMHLNREIEGIRLLMTNKIDAPDMPGSILLYFAHLALEDGKKRKAEEYFERANLTGFDFTDFKNVYEIKNEENPIMKSLIGLGIEND